MVTRATAPLGAPCWIDLLTSDVERSRRFYGQLLGWEAAEPSEEFGGYFMFLRQGVPVAGGMPNAPEMGTDDHWSVYLATADVAKTAGETTATGGAVAVPPMPIADMGTMAVLVDSGGAQIGTWQPGTFPGFTVLAEPGAPCWFELHTRDYAGSLAFYRDVFGWGTSTVEDTPQFRYTTLGEGDAAMAGVMDTSVWPDDGTPARWWVYFAVEDADAAAAEIERLGGSVTQSPEDTPYGRLLTAVDPVGAPFKLMGANRGTS